MGTEIINGMNGQNGKKNGQNRKNGKCKKNRSDDWREDYWDSFEETPLFAAIGTYMSYAVLILVGHIRDLMRRIGLESPKSAYGSEPSIPGFVPLFQSWEGFFSRNLYRRVQDSFNRPISSMPGAYMDVVTRNTHDHGWNFEVTKESKTVLNFASYNYLGFAENKGPCKDAVEKATSHYGICAGGSRQELGYLDIHRKLDNLVAEYLGVEAAITFPMGFASNSMNMSCLVNKGCLIFSDELNHSSLILGSRLSGAAIKTYKHNNMEDLEKKLKNAIINGQPRTHKAWKKILLVVEGVYSMEGSVICLPEIIRLKKKYKTYVWLDEAHSVGAMGPNGRGVVDHFGIEPKDIDILMGTFTKSFGSSGGYLAGPKKLINHFRCNSSASIYSAIMSPSVAQQVISSMTILMGKDGTNEGMRRISQLRENIHYVRRRLHEMGFIIFGNKDSPIVPLLIYYPARAICFSRETLKRGLGTVVVGFPATPLVEGRARLCLSAAHTREEIDKALKIISEVGDDLRIKYSKKPLPKWCEDNINANYLKQAETNGNPGSTSTRIDANGNSGAPLKHAESKGIHGAH